MSVHKKLQDARIKLQASVLKKSGLNKFAGFQYFELGDFLPTVQSIFHEVGLSSTVCFTADSATLKIVDTEDASFDIFTCPVVVPTMKGCNEVQALGAMITYIRRYLYVNALEIVEHDAMDAVIGKDEKHNGKPASNPDFKPSDEELAFLNDTVNNVKGCAKPSEALQFLKDLEADEYAWVFDKLDSKVRSAIKKYQESLKQKDEI